MLCIGCVNICSIKFNHLRYKFQDCVINKLFNLKDKALIKICLKPPIKDCFS